MTKPLGVLVIESHRGAAAVAVDPYESWLAARVDDDVVATCETASDTALGELGREILRLSAPTLFGAGILAHQTVSRMKPGATRLHVRFDLPVAVAPGVKQALAVRVLDAVRGAGRTYGPVEVSVDDPT